MIDIKNIKFFIGPMTQNVIDSVIEFAEEYNVNFGFIASRRQIDHIGGYVGYDTRDFIKYVKYKTNKVLVCRDHGGLLQGDLTNIKGLVPTMYDDLYSFICDATHKMDIIHIDPWKKYNKYEQYELGLQETIYNIILINSINSNIKFEIGTEQSIRPFNSIEFEKLLNDLKYELKHLFEKNIKYAVIQSGTKLQNTENVGRFNIDQLKKMINICKQYNVLSKEHNGDYLSNDQIKIRFDNGLNAINIAPEFGVLETKILLDHINNNIDFDKIYNICYDGKKWIKWINNSIDPLQDKTKIIEISGHYHNKEIKQIVKIDDNYIKEKLKKRLHQLIEL